MNLSWTDLLEEINNLFIKITRDKLFKKETGSIENNARLCFRLNKIEDWNYILASEDILEDSNAAIDNFLKFGLSGPTKLNFIGEKYLRLYGLLNASYLQQQAIINLSKYFQCSNLTKIKNQIDKLEIRELRNQLGAHSVDYLDKDDGMIKAFVPVRITIEDYKISHFEHTKNSFCEVDLKSAVEQHLKFICTTYLSVIDKAVKTIYKSNTDKIRTVTEQCKPFYSMLEGNILIKKCHQNSNADNDYIVIQLVGSDD